MALPADRSNPVFNRLPRRTVLPAASRKLVATIKAHRGRLDIEVLHDEGVIYN
jgi:hypothetical protein